MNDNRLYKQVFLFDKFNCNDNWSSCFKIVCNKADISCECDNLFEINVNDKG